MPTYSKNNILMRAIKKGVLNFINRILQHSEIYATVDNLKHKVERIVQLHHLIMPQILPLEEQSKKIFGKVNTDTTYSNSNLHISKNDLMFLFWLHHSKTIDPALSGYFRTGLMQADIIRKAIKDFFPQKDEIQILDFASGHGRVSRYFKSFLRADQITISDIKGNAVDFQYDTFGYRGFVATANPEEIDYKRHFDFIVVSSLFTHLNKDLFGRWLKTLWNLLNDKGVLSISVHLLDGNDKEEFKYVENSEEDLFPETSENLSGKSIYGLAHLNEKALEAILKNSFQAKFSVVDKRDWAGSQILYSIKKIA
jgi:SAM-dependent methyltransferase